MCNINRTGRRVRLAWGIVMIALAVAAATLAILEVISRPWGWIGCAAFAALGVLGIYESRKGWCVVRAMGIKTPV